MNIKLALSFLLLTGSCSIYSMNCNDQLLKASKAGDLEQVKAALDNGANINMQDASDRNGTPLHFAIHAQNKDLVKYLLEHGADIALKTAGGCTPLHWAVLNNNGAIVQLLLENNADIQACNNNGESTLQYAIDRGYYNLVEFLIAKGAEINNTDNRGMTPLMVAAGFGYDTIVRLLIDKGAELNVQNSGGYTALMIAVHAGHGNSMKLLLEAGADHTLLSKRQTNVLGLAVVCGNIALVDLLLHYGAEVNTQDSKGCTPLHCAVACRNNALAALLLRYGALVDIRDTYGKTPLMWAMEYDNTELVKLLINAGASSLVKYSAQKSMLHATLYWAIVKNKKAILDYFLSIKLSSKAQLTLKSALLCEIIRCGRLDLLDYFVRKGVVIDSKDNDNNTLLHHIASHEHPMQLTQQLITYVLDKGLDVNARNKQGSTPLHVASQFGNVNAVECLLDSGATLNARFFNTWYKSFTPLDMALGKNHSKVIELLLSRGATSAFNQDDNRIPEALSKHKTVETFAQESNFKALKKLIKKGSYATPVARALIEQKYKQFYRAIAQDDVETVKSLAAHNISLNIPDALGNTPLHRAVIAASTKVIEFLLQQSKIDITKRNNAGETALEYAIHRPDKALQAFMKYGYQKQMREKIRSRIVQQQQMPAAL